MRAREADIIYFSKYVLRRSKGTGAGGIRKGTVEVAVVGDPNPVTCCCHFVVRLTISVDMELVLSKP